MITVTSTTAQILQELAEEEPKAQFWLRKMFHGDKGYDKMQQGLINKALMQRKDCRTDVYDYISPKGNRWMVFEHCRYHKDIHYARTMPIAFCYYETYGSVGAFLNGHPQYEGQQGIHAILFTDHFFLRFCSRLGIEMRSRWMVQRFLEIIPGVMFQTTGERDLNGRMKVDCRFPASIGRGIIRKDGPLIEVRTYLTDPELNRKQLRETETLRKIADRHNFDPQDVKMARVLKSGDFATAFEYEIKQLVDLGCDEQSLYMTAAIGVYIVRALCDLNYADATDYNFWKKHGEANKHILIDIAAMWADQHPVNREFVSKIEQIFKNDGIRDYNLVEFINYMFSIMKEDIAKVNEQNNNK